jgi:hypothetical protein
MEPMGDRERLAELLLRALEMETGACEIYKTALRCDCSAELRGRLALRLAESAERRGSIRILIDEFDIESGRMTAGRQGIRHIVQSLVRTIERALDTGDSALTESVALECLAHAANDPIDHELLHSLVSRLKQHPVPSPLSSVSRVWPGSMAG